MHAVRLLSAVFIVAACFADPPVGNDESSESGEACMKGSEACACYRNGTCDAGLLCVDDRCTPTDCEPGRAGCPCQLERCDPGLACIDDRCEAPSPGTTSSDVGDTTTLQSSTSADETTGVVNGIDSSTSTDAESTGASTCGGDCSTCHACAVAADGPCDYDVTCPDDGCQTLLCFMDCVENLGGACESCCTNAPTVMDAKIADCVAEQCATTCDYECVF